MGNRENARKLQEKLKKKNEKPVDEVVGSVPGEDARNDLAPLDEFRTKADLAGYAADEFGVELDGEKKMAEMYADLESAVKDK